MLKNIVPFVSIILTMVLADGSDYSSSEEELTDFQRKLKATQMYPEIIHYYPKYKAEVTWDTGVYADLGNVLPYSKVKNKPTVKWPNNDTTYYSLIFTDYNDTAKADKHLKEYQLWFVCNIPGDDIEKGEEQLEYILPDPQRGPHFVGVAVFEQDTKMNMSDPEWMQEYVRPARNFFAAVEISFDFNALTHAANVYKVSPPTEEDLKA